MYTFKNLTVLTNKIEDKDFSTCAPCGRLDSYVLILFHTKILFSYDGKEYFSMGKNSLIVYPPYHCQAYKGDDTSFLNSFIGFSIDKEYFSRFKFPLDVIFNISPAYEERILNLIDKISFIINTTYDLDKRKNVPYMIDEVFALVERAYLESIKAEPSTASTHSLFSDIRHKMLNDPLAFPVKKMVEMSGYSATYFGICYQKYFGVKPIIERQQQVVRIIREYLETTNYSLEKIAELCSIGSVSYLIKMFTKFEHITPHQYKLRMFGEKPTEPHSDNKKQKKSTPPA